MRLKTIHFHGIICGALILVLILMIIAVTKQMEIAENVASLNEIFIRNVDFQWQ